MHSFLVPQSKDDNVENPPPHIGLSEDEVASGVSKGIRHSRR